MTTTQTPSLLQQLTTVGVAYDTRSVATCPECHRAYIVASPRCAFVEHGIGTHNWVRMSWLNELDNAITKHLCGVARYVRRWELALSIGTDLINTTEVNPAWRSIIGHIEADACTEHYTCVVTTTRFGVKAVVSRASGMTMTYELAGRTAFDA